MREATEEEEEGSGEDSLAQGLEGILEDSMEDLVVARGVTDGEFPGTIAVIKLFDI